MTKKSLHKLAPRTAIVVAFLLVVIVTASVSFYFYSKYQKAQDLLKTSAAASQNEVQMLVGTVGKLIELPNEEPTVATISDVSKLEGQKFFANAKNGDKVLIFQNAKKAVLYRPSVNKIIEVGPVNIGATLAPSAGATKSGTVSPTLEAKTKIALYNGTNTPGLTKSVEKKLGDAKEPFTVVAKENAEKADYEETIVIDLSGTHAAAATRLAKALSGKVSSFPAGEVKPKEAQLLVILGADYQ